MRKAEIYLEYQNYIDYMPIAPKELYGQACSSDEVTINSWRDTWQKNIKSNFEKYGPFESKSIGKLFGSKRHKPVIIAGAGPSLKYNVSELKNKKDITLISCLHNFHFFEDNGIDVDYYVSLDAGPVTIEEVSEGGAGSPDDYWEKTKGKTLLCYIGTHPDLLKNWKGEVYFFNAPVPDTQFMDYVNNIEVFNTFVSNGGNVLGACLYIARAIMGASVIAFIGADFCFSYDKKFHPFDSKYDKNLGNTLRVKDVFGNSVYTWRSYHNFKGWFECISFNVPGIYYNCSEGGTLGAYTEGNIRCILQVPLKDFIRQMNMFEEIEEQCLNPKTKDVKLLF